MTNEELLALARLVRFLIRTSPMNSFIMAQSISARDALFCDEATVDMMIERMEENESD